MTTTTCPQTSTTRPAGPHRASAGRTAPTTAGIVLTTAMLVLVGGAAIGIGTQALQGVLPGSWNVLANSGLMWALGAAALGWLAPNSTSAIVGGAAGLVVATNTYYLATEWFEHADNAPRGAVVWSVAAVAAGVVFGGVGQLIRRHPDLRWSAAAVIAAVALLEGFYLVVFVDRLRSAGIVEIIGGAVLAAVCLGSDRRPLRVLAALAGAGLAAAAAGVVIDAAFQVI